MQFIASNEPFEAPAGPYCLLSDNNWDDWFKYQTVFNVIYYDGRGSSKELGQVKIGRFGLTPSDRRAQLPVKFASLADEFFSLGQGEDYYIAISELPLKDRTEIFIGLRDVAFDPVIFERASTEQVLHESLMRSVDAITITGRYYRLAHGNAQLTPYAFSINIDSTEVVSELQFNVIPDSSPPTNIHVLIGRNGVGKTTAIRKFVERLYLARVASDPVTDPLIDPSDPVYQFAGVVSVAFSAFDPFFPVPNGAAGIGGMKFSYVGLKLEPQVGNLGDSQAKSLVDLRNEFVASVGVCVKGIKSERWLAALRTLESDPLFADAEITSLVSDTAVEAAGATFDKLSAGHRIVLLTITKLVELVEERTLVLMDEPEGHLHPPLLSAFVRALSDLLIGRNGVAVIATHSPVVLQEVPSKCVWLLQRTGRSATAYRPSLETFGENVGLLTREVFGLEVSQAGFHSLLERAVKEVGGDYSAVLSYFDGQLGAEARAIARVLTASTSKSSEK